MSLKFWLGSIRSDKNRKLLLEIISKAKANPNKQYLIIVPEQFVFSTQRELVYLSDNHGILNIDVLSFMRFAHRISDEVGADGSVVTILDEMGKTLILQHLANENKDKLTIFGDNIDKLGYITKIKSLISELMQYGVKPDKVDEMIANAAGQGKGILESKLKDINSLYRAFLEYIKDKFTTTEETLDHVASIIPASKTVAGSEIVFEGFTGFTPVQIKLIGTLMEYADCIHVSLMMEESDADNADKETELFHLTKQTMAVLGRLADDRRVVSCDDYKAWEDKSANESISKPELSIFVGQNPEEEIKMTADRIRKLIATGDYRYKDIAIVTGDLEGYRSVCEQIFGMMNIPYFVDRTQPLLLNPFVEYIRAIISIYAENYSYEAMFRFLKSGILSYDVSDINALENYCLALGIKGRKKWHTPFTRTTRYADLAEVDRVEKLRQEIVTGLDRFSANLLGYEYDASSDNNQLINAATKSTVRNFAVALYKMIVADGIEDRLQKVASDYKRDGSFTLAEEYKQVYRRIMDILDELVALIPDEKVDIRSFGNLLNAGLDSLHIGVIPKSTDYIQIGDLTRSRVGDVKALFVVGANDGIIPHAAPAGGIINEADRQFLVNADENLVLAPGAREDAYTQRLYLYMAFNKPSKRLFLSYANVNKAGKSQMPSYIVKQYRKDNSDISVESAGTDVRQNLLGEKIAFSEFVSLLNRVVNEGADEADKELAKSLLKYFLSNDKYKAKTKELVTYLLISRVSKMEGTIGKAVASALYGKTIYGSVTNLETYANCAYQYFLRYGLGLKERELYSFEASDLGSLFHDSLLGFTSLMEAEGVDWLSISDEDMTRLMDKAVDDEISKEKLDALYSSARTYYMVNRVKRIMRRTANVLTGQLRKGSFVPKYFEVDFDKISSIDNLKIKLSDDEMMRLYGRVDRIDTCEREDGIYVKIIDYKSSNKKMDLAAVYEGRQLQLLVYLDAAISHEKSLGKKEVIPAGILYYHIDDPMVKAVGSESDDDIRSSILKKLKVCGLINSDNNGSIVELIDNELNYNPTVVNVRRLVKGGLAKSNELITGDDFDTLSKYVNMKIRQMGRKILDGDISIPVPDGDNRFTGPNCTYCEYSSVCVNREGILAGDDESDAAATEDGNSEDSFGGNSDVKVPSKDEVLELMRSKIE